MLRFLPVLLLAGCPNFNPTPTVYIDGNAFLFNRTNQAVQVQVSVIERVDCTVLEFPGLAASIPAGEMRTVSVEAGQLLTPWSLAASSDTDPSPSYASFCQVGNVMLDENVATVVINPEVWTEIETPVSLGALARETVVIQDEEPRLTDGSTGFISDPTTLPACPAAGPTWTGTTGLSTILGRRHHAGCEFLELADSTEISVCNGPPLPFLLGEHITTTIEETVFSVTTAAGGKPYLLARNNSHLPAWIELDRVTPNFETVVREERCQIPTPCGAAIAAAVNVSTTTLPPRVMEWGDHRELTSPTGSLRLFTLFRSGVPMAPGCSLQATFALTPRKP